MMPFQKKWYYTHEMKGSYSIKFVLPALVPELSYDELEIKEVGTKPQILFYQWLMVHLRVKPQKLEVSSWSTANWTLMLW